MPDNLKTESRVIVDDNKDLVVIKSSYSTTFYNNSIEDGLSLEISIPKGNNIAILYGDVAGYDEYQNKLNFKKSYTIDLIKKN